MITSLTDHTVGWNKKRRNSTFRDKITLSENSTNALFILLNNRYRSPPPLRSVISISKAWPTILHGFSKLKGRSKKPRRQGTNNPAQPGRTESQFHPNSILWNKIKAKLKSPTTPVDVSPCTGTEARAITIWNVIILTSTWILQQMRFTINFIMN